VGAPAMEDAAGGRAGTLLIGGFCLSASVAVSGDRVTALVSIPKNKIFSPKFLIINKMDAFNLASVWPNYCIQRAYPQIIGLKGLTGSAVGVSRLESVRRVRIGR
jgi:hypothetical protein